MNKDHYFKNGVKKSKMQEISVEQRKLVFPGRRGLRLSTFTLFLIVLYFLVTLFLNYLFRSVRWTMATP